MIRNVNLILIKRKIVRTSQARVNSYFLSYFRKFYSTKVEKIMLKMLKKKKVENVILTNRKIVLTGQAGVNSYSLEFYSTKEGNCRKKKL